MVLVLVGHGELRNIFVIGDEDNNCRLTKLELEASVRVERRPKFGLSILRDIDRFEVIRSLEIRSDRRYDAVDDSICAISTSELWGRRMRQCWD
jgi:hypothetical protein